MSSKEVILSPGSTGAGGPVLEECVGANSAPIEVELLLLNASDARGGASGEIGIAEGGKGEDVPVRLGDLSPVGVVPPYPRIVLTELAHVQDPDKFPFGVQ